MPQREEVRKNMKIQKAVEIMDARISFVSLVAKAANKRQFLITKADGGNAQFSTYGKILKADAETHFVTGIVYEPLTEDADGNFMTAAEIQKAAHWFAKNSDKVDVQHSYEAVAGTAVVESYIAPCDLTIGDTPVIKGTWVMTVEIENTELWDAIQKGDICGFSMGGVGKYSEEDVNLDGIAKTAPATAAEKDTPLTEPQKKGIVKTVLSAFGFDVVEKGKVAENYLLRTKSENFWYAFYALQETLSGWDYANNTRAYTDNEETVREALADFNAIVTNLLLDESITKTLSEAAPVNKAGKKISTANKKKLDDAYQLLTELCESFDDTAEEDVTKKEKEDPSMNEEIKKAIEEAVASAFAAHVEKTAAPADGNPDVKPPETQVTPEPITTEAIQKMIAETVEKAFEERGLKKETAPTGVDAAASALTADEVQKMVNEIVEPILKSRGLPSNLNNESSKQVEKSSEAFDGFFI